ncbi:MAG: hypothetical protein WA459_04485 [Stellaceae bacterium]
MTPRIEIRNCARFVFAGLAAIAAIATLWAAPAKAGVFFNFGVPFPGYYGPGPYYYGYPAPYPYAYGYPPAAYYPPPAYPYYPPTAYAPPAAAPTASASATAAITYTSKPAFTNSAGQTCREYKTTSSGREVLGTACKQADGQWRVVN